MIRRPFAESKGDVLRAMRRHPEPEVRWLMNWTYHQFGHRYAAAALKLVEAGWEVRVQQFGRGFILNGHQAEAEDLMAQAVRLGGAR